MSNQLVKIDQQSFVEWLSGFEIFHLISQVADYGNLIQIFLDVKAEYKTRFTVNDAGVFCGNQLLIDFNQPDQHTWLAQFYAQYSSMVTIKDAIAAVYPEYEAGRCDRIFKQPQQSQDAGYIMGWNSAE